VATRTETSSLGGYELCFARHGRNGYLVATDQIRELTWRQAIEKGTRVGWEWSAPIRDTVLCRDRSLKDNKFSAEVKIEAV
jgi:hypothetical protein